ncbi:MAG: hypothetical protein NTX25_24115 [Proteobacteria bacterium]|nr:hypothetical protein [Pseudomonadota bacterium]
MRVFSCLFSLLLLACTTVQSISISQIPSASTRNKRITSSASSPIIFAIPFGHSFVERARDDLISQCPNGQIDGVLSKHQSKDYFLSLVLVNEVVMEAYCHTSHREG